jgi:ABC-type oligopeptide transport system substrate-binding subunit
MTGRISRRGVLAAGPLALAACGRAQESYFGKTDPPRTQRLVYLLDAEPRSLDPVQANERQDEVILSLFEGLTGVHPTTGEPIAGLATYYDVTPDGLIYRFRLRGHAQPVGRRLSSRSDLPAEFSRGPAIPFSSSSARWTDGVPIHAQDFVYSWRRAVDPATAADYAFLFDIIRNAEEISAGKLPPEALAVRALDDFTLQVDLRAPAPFFLELVSGRMFCPVPRHVIKAAGRSWTEPGRFVSNGAFRLKERRPDDRLILARNPFYYDAAQVSLEEVTFLVVRDSTARLNLYKAGIGAVMQPWVPAIIPTLRRKKDFRPQESYASEFWAVNTTTPPLNDVRVRYALNMATDKRQIADLAAAGSIPAAGLVPPGGGYSQNRTLPVSIDGRIYDVLSFNPEAARTMLANAAVSLPKQLDYFCPTMPDSMLWAQVLHGQWKAHLGVDLTIVAVELSVWGEAIHKGRFRHIAESGTAANYVDPVWFLELLSGQGGYGTSWSDPVYDRMLSDAKAASDPALRLKKLAECERYLLLAMPILPLCHDVQPKLRKPFVKGLGSNLLNREQPKYAWIDTHWRPQ